MSQWDFGYGREPTEHHEPRYPQQTPPVYPEQPGPEHPYEQSAEYPYEQDPGYAYPQEPQYGYPQGPPGPPYPPAQLAPDPYPQDPDYPYPYTPPPAAEPISSPGQGGWSDDGGWPAGEGYPDGGEAYDPIPYPITYERDGFEGRASLPVAPQPVAPQPDVTPPYGSWPDTAEPVVRVGQPAPEPWRPPPPPPPVGDLGAADVTQAWSPGRPPGYPDDGVAYRRPDRRLGRPGDRPPPAGAARHRDRGPWPAGDDREWDDRPAGVAG